jgi:hypothetical protein
VPLTRRQFIGAATGLVVAGPGPAVPARALTINPRSSWTSEPPKGPLSSEDVKFLLVHHSASHNGHTASEVPAILRSWYAYHTGPEKGWPDIAYNFVIDSAGGVWEGREGSLDDAVAGSATGGNQGFSQLVCLIGDTNASPATPAAHASLVQVLAWLADRFAVSTAPGAEVSFVSRGSNKWPEGTSVTTPTIAGHRDMSQTTCPGNDLYGYVTGSLRGDVEAARGGSPPPPPPSSTTSSTSSSTSTTVAPTTTTIPPSTTVPQTSTTTVPTTSTTRPTTTTLATTTTTPPTTVPTGSTTLPVLAAEVAPSAGAPVGMLATAGALVVSGVGLLAWRYRRMGN